MVTFLSKEVDTLFKSMYCMNMKEMRIRNVPDEVHRGFKILCTKKDTNMNEYLIRLMKKEIKKDKKK